MIAGPSEVSIIADKNSNPRWIASDMIAQAEHDIFAQSILISNDLNLIKEVNFCILKQLKEIPKRVIASKSLKNYGLAIYAKKIKTILKIVNEIAPDI